MDQKQKYIKKRTYIEAFPFNYEIPKFLKTKLKLDNNFISVTNQIINLDINPKIKKSIYIIEDLIVYIISKNFTKYNYCYEK